MNMLDKIKIEKWLNGRELEENNSAHTLLLFYSPKCHGCIFSALPNMVNLFNHMDPSVLRFLAIQIHNNTDDWFKKEINLDKIPFPVGLDHNMESYNSFDADGVPHWYFLTPEGEIKHQVMGSDRGAMSRLAYALEELSEIPIIFD